MQNDVGSEKARRVGGGTVLSAGDFDYSDMTTIGKIEIEVSQQFGGVGVHVHGFEFDEAQTCRLHVAKSLAWARDVLEANIQAMRVVPGGSIISSTGLDQSELLGVINQGRKPV